MATMTAMQARKQALNLQFQEESGELRQKAKIDAQLELFGKGLQKAISAVQVSRNVDSADADDLYFFLWPEPLECDSKDYFDRAIKLYGKSFITVIPNEAITQRSNGKYFYDKVIEEIEVLGFVVRKSNYETAHGFIGYKVSF